MPTDDQKLKNKMLDNQRLRETDKVNLSERIELRKIIENVWELVLDGG